MERRKLRVSPDVPGFEYQYKVCVKKFLGICTKREMHKDVYDLRDETVRRRFIDMNFIVQVRDLP